MESVMSLFTLTTLAMFFFFGEILIRMKGIGAIIGIITIGMYFSANLSSIDLILVGIGFAVGLGMIIADGKLLNDGILGIIGFIVLNFSIAFAAPDALSASYSIAGVILGSVCSLILLKVPKLPKRKMWGKMTLKDQLTSDQGYNSINDSHTKLIGKTGVTETVLRPTGTIVIDDERYDAVSQAEWIERGKTIKVISVDGTRILVERLD
ncbi:NfeD family protein [Alkalibacillus salilacus]|uniref:Membrane-bound ClpP family serine protease n=1 Tax=Alkalibacillus salilacus TaxID=284582 RepID=A0ABT9VCD9_9BACI|nr:NfeD family protein [Alkalibacillus salilacus]MDQ0158638.1 membrane-bound ClpP family serine protease [Alkalibacillus salilacus]